MPTGKPKKDQYIPSAFLPLPFSLVRATGLMRDTFLDVEFGLGTYSPLARPVMLRVILQSTAAGEGHKPANTRTLARCCLFPDLLTDEDIGELIFLYLMRFYGAPIARYASTCKGFLKIMTHASQRLLDEGIAYWTGNQPPLKPPLLFSATGTTMKAWRDPALVSMRVNTLLAQHCSGADSADVLRILEGGWCTNFTIDLAIKASGIPTDLLIADDAPVQLVGDLRARLLESTLLTRVQMAGGPAAFASAHPSWHAQLEETPFVVCALNSGNTHWAAVRVWQQGDAEVFDSMKGATSAANVEGILHLLSHFGWESGKQIRFYSFPHFMQSDGNSCGVITAAAVISLLREHQLGVSFADIKLWRHYFAHAIYCLALNSPLQGSPDY